MEYFAIRASFQDFFPYLKSKMEPMDRHKLCLMYKDTEGKQDIYFATETPELKKIIASKYNMEPCGQPKQVYNDHPDQWMFRGNQALMGI